MWTTLPFAVPQCPNLCKLMMFLFLGSLDRLVYCLF